MQQEKTFLNELEEKEKLGTLKTLTILTFIGSGVLFLLSAWGFANGKSGYEKMQQMISDGTVDKLPDFLKGMYSPEKMEVMRKSVENGLPIFIITTISLALCVYGAMQMRKLKADGYWMWLIGEILPNLAALFFVGAGYFSGMLSFISLAIIAVFIVLYSLQRKHLS